MPHWLQIVPRLPIEPDGLGQYAIALDEAWDESRRRQPPTHPTVSLLSADPRAATARAASGTVSRLAAATPSELTAAARGASGLLLHYVGYGYDRRGCPGWLVDGVEALRRQPNPPRLVTYFHEIYASGPPWTSSFWLSGRQRRLARRLVRASDAVVTSMRLYAQILRPWLLTGQSVIELPLLSTIGEPNAVPRLEDRPNRLVVFGGAGVRARSWVGHREDLVRACRATAPTEIIDIGPGNVAPASLEGIPIRRLGPLSAAAVSSELLASRVAFLAYPDGFLAKSTIFAAYASHGLWSVRAWRGRSPADGAHERHLCWNVSASPEVPGEPARLAQAATSWYHEHRRERHREILTNLLAGTPSPGL